MDGTATYGGSNSSPNYSGSIWGDCPVESLRDKQSTGPGGFIWEKVFDHGGPIPDGTGASWNGLEAYGSTGAAAVSGPDSGEVGGGFRIGSDGDNEGVGFRAYETPVKIILGGGDFWFESRVKSSTIADTKHGIFLGLGSTTVGTAIGATVPIQADGTLADMNLVGFHRLEGDGDYFDAVYRADGVAAVTAQADAAVIVADTYMNLGMKFVSQRNIGRGAGYLYWYLNGVKVAYKLIPSTAGTDFPNDVNLGFYFAVLNATASTPGTSSIKNVRMAQVIR